MFSPPVTSGQQQKPPLLRKVSEMSVERTRQLDNQNKNNNIITKSKRTASSSSTTNRRTSSSATTTTTKKKPTPELELYATLIDAVTSAFQNRAPSLVLPPAISANFDISSSSLTNQQQVVPPQTLQSMMHLFIKLAQEALLAFASLELSTSNTEKSRLSTKQTDTGSYSTSVVAALGESAATVSKRTEALINIMKQLQNVFSPSSSSAAASSQQQQQSRTSRSTKNNNNNTSALLLADPSVLKLIQFLPNSFTKSVDTSLKQGLEAVDDIRLSAKSIHNVRKAIVSRDVDAAQLLLIDQTAADNTTNTNTNGQQQGNSSNSNNNFLPSLLLRWLRRHWIPSMKIWNEIIKRFEEESVRIVKQNSLKLQTDEDTLAILNELIKKYRQEILKKSRELMPITLPGQSLDQLIVDSIEQPLAKNLESLKKKAGLIEIFKQGIDTLNMVALSQATKEWKTEFGDDNNTNNQLYHEAKRTIERLQSLGKITAGLTMALQQQQQQQNSSSSSYKTALHALHQASSLILNEKWYANETQCSLVVGFGERLQRSCGSNEKEYEKELLAVATNRNNKKNDDNGNNTSLDSVEDFSSSSSSFNRDLLMNNLIVDVETSSRRKNTEAAAKYWPKELTELYRKVAEELIVNRLERKHMFNAVSGLAKKLLNVKSGNSNNGGGQEEGEQGDQGEIKKIQQQQQLLIGQARQLLNSIFKKNNNQSETSTSSASPSGKKLQDAISQLQKAVSDNSSRTVKVHYESNLRLVRLEDSFSFAETMKSIQESLEIPSSSLSLSGEDNNNNNQYHQGKGPLRVRVADEDGDYITVVSQREWDLILKEFALAGSGGKLELYLDHVRPNTKQQQQQLSTPPPAPPPQSQQQQQQKNVFTTSNANQRPVTGFAFRQSPRTPLNNNNNEQQQKGFARPTTSSAAKKSAIQSLTIEGKSPQVIPVANQNIQNNQNSNNHDDSIRPSIPEEAQNEPSYPISLHFSPPGSKDPQPEQYPSRILQEKVASSTSKPPKQQQQQPSPSPSSPFMEKLQGARNQKIMIEKQHQDKKNDNDEDDQEEEQEQKQQQQQVENTNKNNGFWQKPSSSTAAQEFDLMTVASNSTVATNKTDASVQLAMKALAKKKWGAGAVGAGGLEKFLAQQQQQQQIKGEWNKNNTDEDPFELQTVTSEATNGFHIEDHLDLLMGQQQERAQKLNTNTTTATSAITPNNITFNAMNKNIYKPGGVNEVAPSAKRRLPIRSGETHNRIFGGGGGGAYALPTAAGGKKNNDKNDDDMMMMIQGKSTRQQP